MFSKSKVICLKQKKRLVNPKVVKWKELLLMKKELLFYSNKDINHITVFHIQNGMA